YEHYPDKQSCFLAAYDHGSRALFAAVTAASIAAADDGMDAIGQLRAATRAYLAFLVDEASYARVFFLEILSAGPEAVARQRECRTEFARSLRAWHEHARKQRPRWPVASELTYEAATGALHEVALGRGALMP